MASEDSLLSRDQKSTPTTLTQLQYEEPEAGQNELTMVEANRPSWFTRCKRDVVADLRSTKWRKFGKRYLLGFWIFCLTIMATTLPGYLYLAGQGPIETSVGGNFGLGSPGCLPNDAFNARSMAYNVFDPSGLFQITHGFGNLTFTQAKVIDLIWDIGVGRVGQTALAYFSWKAFSAYFKASMDTNPVTYSTFWAIFLDRQPSVTSIYRVIRDFTRQQTRRSKAMMVFIPLNMLFVLVFPILMSAMTGYRPNSAAFVADSVNSLIPFEKFTLAAYIIHDGDRLNLTKDYVVPFVSPMGFFDLRRESAPTFRAFESFDITDDASFAGASMFICANRLPSGCYLSYNVSQYAEMYGFYGLDSKTGKPVEIETKWMDDITLKPSLNISAFYLPPPGQGSLYGIPNFYGHDWVDPRTNTKPFANVSNLALNVEGTTATYTLDYVQQHGSCQQLNTYQWGFSFLLVFIMAILLLIWTCGTYMLRLGAHKALETQHHSEADKEVPSEYKAALTFASTLQFEMATTGQERPEGLTNQQLKQAIQQDLNGGRIPSTSSSTNTPTSAPVVQAYSIPKELWELMKRRPFYLSVLAVLTAYMTIVALFPVYPPAGAGAVTVIPIHTGFVFAIAIGRTTRSRAVFAWAGILAMLLIMVLVGGILTAVWT